MIFTKRLLILQVTLQAVNCAGHHFFGDGIKNPFQNMGHGQGGRPPRPNKPNKKPKPEKPTMTHQVVVETESGKA